MYNVSLNYCCSMLLKQIKLKSNMKFGVVGRLLTASCQNFTRWGDVPYRRVSAVRLLSIEAILKVTFHA